MIQPFKLPQPRRLRPVLVSGRSCGTTVKIPATAQVATAPLKDIPKGSIVKIPATAQVATAKIHKNCLIYHQPSNKNEKVSIF